MPPTYPSEPFKQADSLLTGLLEEYRGARDAASMHDIQSLVDTTVKMAREREFKAHNIVRELSQRTAATEAAAVYGDAKAQHEQRMSEVNATISDTQASLQQAQADLARVADQHKQVAARQQQLQADRQHWAQQEADPEPLLLRLISLYAHISGMAFDYSTLDAPVTRAEVTGFLEAGIRAISLDHSASAFDTTNRLWGQIPGPAPQADGGS